MAMTNQQDFEPHIISTCQAHSNGDGRDCTYGTDSEYYSTNTLNASVSVSVGSGSNQ